MNFIILMFVKMWMPTILDLVTQEAEKLVSRSTNTIDDNFVKILVENRAEILQAIKAL